MIDSLYIEAAKKRNSISEIILEIENEGNISEFWENIPFMSSNDDFSIAAGDGSFNRKQFLSFTFYAVGCESVIYDGDFSKIEDGEVDSMEYTHYIHELLRTYMSIFELKNAIKTIKDKKIDYYLIDGSIYGDLIRPFPTGLKLTNKRKEEILNRCLEDLKNSIKHFNFKLNGKRIINKEYKGYSDKTDAIMFLSSIEQLLLIEELLKYRKNLISISKTSTTRDIFDTNIPDISIFDKYSNKSGISKITYKKVLNNVNDDFFVDDEYFKNLVFTIFYLRLEDNKNILKVELPYKANREEIIELAEILNKHSTDGYPYLLKKAHKDVVITNKDMDKLAQIVNIREKIGREMLK